MTGISPEEGLTDYILDGIEIQRKMIQISDEIIVLAHSSKFDYVSLLRICDIHEADRIITDSKLDKRIFKKYISKGIQVVYE